MRKGVVPSQPRLLATIKSVCGAWLLQIERRSAS